MNIKPTSSDPVKNSPGRGRVLRLASGKQRRLNVLMERSNQRPLNKAELKELRALVREVEELTVENARRMAEQRR
jgi:hypothetical protein